MMKKINDLIILSKGKKPKNILTKNKIGYLPYVDIKAFEQGIVDNYTDGEKCLPCEDGDLLIVCDGSRSGLVGKAIKGYVGSTLARIDIDDSVIPEYIYYFIQGKYKQLNTNMKGTGTPHINQDLLKSFDIYVPTINEQKKIVSKIEELFSQLDSGVETLKKTKEQLKIYRQAVLKEAFEGKYIDSCQNSKLFTLNDYESIKIENPIFKDISGDENEIKIDMPNYAIKIRLGNVFEVEVGATPKRAVSEYWNGDICWVSSGEVKFNTINDTKEKITENGVESSSTNIQPTGTVLLAMIGEGKTRGQAAILNIPAAHNQNTAAILVSKTPCNPKYIYYFLLLNYENTRRVGSGNNRKALNKERVRALRFPFVSFKEQHEIVKEIESRLSICDSIEKTIDKSLQEAEALRQSILKQAFEGGLV